MTPRRGCSFLPFLWGCCRWGGPPNFSWVFVTSSFLAVAGSRAPGWWRGASHGRCGGVRWPRGEASRAKADCGRGAVGRLVASSHGGGVRLLEQRGGRRPRWLGWRHPHRATAACGHPGGAAPPSVQVGANARRAAAATASFTLPYQPRLFPYPLGCARVTPPHAQEWHRRPWPLRAAALPSSRLVHLGETLLAAGKRLACAIVFAPRWDGTPRVALLRGSLPPLRPPPSVYFGSHLYGMALKR